MGWQRRVIQNIMTTNHLDTCETGREIDCPECVADGVIQTHTCGTCGTARWVHVCDDGTIYSPVSQ